MKIWNILLIVLSCQFLTLAEASIKPNSINKDANLITEVMVLGSTHLSTEKEFIAPAELESVHARLKAFNPDVIAIESLRPIDIANMQASHEIYGGVLNQFVGQEFLQLSKMMQDAKNTSARKAMKKYEIVLAKNSSELELFELAVASVDKYNGLLHWIRLSENEKEKLSVDLNDYFKKLTRSNNENFQLAIRLANSLKHNRIYQIDDHQDKKMMPLISNLAKSFATNKQYKKLMESHYITHKEKLVAEARDKKDWMPVYKWVNSKAYQDLVINEEWKLFTDKDLNHKEGTTRLAMWDVRNLNMVSHIMTVVAKNPGKKVLITVGSNHKIFFETLLKELFAVKVVDF